MLDTLLSVLLISEYGMGSSLRTDLSNSRFFVDDDLWSLVLTGSSMVFMLLCVWSMEFPNAQISIYGLVTLKAFCLPWVMLVFDAKRSVARESPEWVRFASGSSMSSPAEFYNSLPPITKAYGTLCVLATIAYQIGLLNPANIALFYSYVFSRFQVWRLFTNFFFLGNFSINFGIRLLMIIRYGVQLENGPFERRTADFLWMMIFGALSLLVLSAIPLLWSPFLGTSLVFMLLYVWSREFPNAQISIYGLVTLKAFYLPWAMLALDVIFGSSPIPDLLGIIAGHLYYFLTVLHPLAGGRSIVKTPTWLRKLVERWVMRSQTNRNTEPERTTGAAFRGRSYRLNG
ncbi:hypothetical protein NE237_029076 [Protea cynaroides]|uniref:Derlin n=1 Tax=Protea cynaroides TaxID=273540 RepID=A0A9Q0GRI1_9MAGN|nr:hypothetical protein NE237_029076 [Protea cynaroides]